MRATDASAVEAALRVPTRGQGRPFRPSRSQARRRSFSASRVAGIVAAAVAPWYMAPTVLHFIEYIGARHE